MAENLTVVASIRLKPNDELKRILQQLITKGFPLPYWAYVRTSYF